MKIVNPGKPWLAVVAWLLASQVYAGIFTIGFTSQCNSGTCGSDSCAQTSCPDKACAPKKYQCPPPYFWYTEGPPRLRFKKACPRPVCDPCNLEHYGYYQTCWRPWAYPPDWSHCPVPPPGVVLPPPATPPYAPRIYPQPTRSGGNELPAPRPEEEPIDRSLRR